MVSDNPNTGLPGEAKDYLLSELIENNTRSLFNIISHSAQETVEFTLNDHGTLQAEWLSFDSFVSLEIGNYSWGLLVLQNNEAVEMKNGYTFDENEILGLIEPYIPKS